MGNKVSSMLQDEEIEAISEETGFSAAQVERLYSRFTSLDKSGICGSLSRQDFLRVPELAINPLCDRIVHMFFVDCDDDHDRINFRQFMKVLATFRSSSAKQQQHSNQTNTSNYSSDHHSQTNHQQHQQHQNQNSSSLDESAIGDRSKNPDGCIQNILSSLSQSSSFLHSRHSSCDAFLNYYPVQHHTTNQHSIHYVASTTHLSSSSQNPFSSSHSNNNSHPLIGNMNNNNNFNSSHSKKPQIQSLIDPDEPANSRKQKLFFMFKIYDVDDDNRISLGDLLTILKIMVGNYISEKKLVDLAEKTLRHADKNCNGFIEFDEFCAAFSHRDIDEALRVKFSTQASESSGESTANKNR